MQIMKVSIKTLLPKATKIIIIFDAPHWLMGIVCLHALMQACLQMHLQTLPPEEYDALTNHSPMQ